MNTFKCSEENGKVLFKNQGSHTQYFQFTNWTRQNGKINLNKSSTSISLSTSESLSIMFISSTSSVSESSISIMGILLIFRGGAYWGGALISKILLFWGRRLLGRGANFENLTFFGGGGALIRSFTVLRHFDFWNSNLMKTRGSPPPRFLKHYFETKKFSLNFATLLTIYVR